MAPTIAEERCSCEMGRRIHESGEGVVKKLILFTAIVSLFVLATSRSEIVSGGVGQGRPSEGLAHKETYVSEVVPRAPWAEKNLVYDGEESPPGEFGLHALVIPDSLRGELPDPPLPEGPTAFTVAPNGDIYVTDPLNKRIQRFTAHGSFVSVIPIPHFEKSKYVNSYAQEWSLICVDQHHNVYLLWWEDYTEQYLCKYDQQGTLLNIYPFFAEVRFGGAGRRLYCDDSNGLFFEYARKVTDQIILLLKDELSLKKPSAPFTFQIGTADQVFSAEEQRASLRRGVREIPGMSELAERAWKEPPGKSWGPEIWNHDIVDEKGNLYHYWRTKEGIIIVKWHKV